jgi:hypothetical protein
LWEHTGEDLQLEWISSRERFSFSFSFLRYRGKEKRKFNIFNILQLFIFLERKDTRARSMQATETDDGVVDLNVGGKHYSTTLATLCRYPDSMLAAMFSGRHELKKRAADGRVFIDRDGKAFGYVLQFP